MNTYYRSATVRGLLFALLLGSQFLLTACAPAASNQPIVSNVKIGVLNGGKQFDAVLASFKATLTDAGYVEGKNVTYVYDSAATSPDKLAASGQTLVTAKVDLIVSLGTPASQAAQKATVGTTIPVVFGPLSDPVASGLVKSVQNPGGNITGVATGLQVHTQRLEFLTKLSANIKRVFLPYDPADAAGASIVKSVQDAAPKLGVEIIPLQIHTDDDVTAAIANFPTDVDAIFVVPSTIIAARLTDLVKAGVDHKLPTSSNVESQVNQGVVLTYSFSDEALGKQMGRIADKILKGAKPADVPVETSEFFLAVNLKTAQAINLTIPDDMLAQAHTIVR